MAKPSKTAKIYYVVIHGKCPGIYDNWDAVQDNVKGFPNGEYSSKRSKKEAIELFHAKRPEFPKLLIPDFTVHASNRLKPLDGTRRSAGDAEFSGKSGKAREGRFSRVRKARSRSLTPTRQDDLLKVPPSRGQNRPEKIILQQNWLTSPAVSRSPSPSRSSMSYSRRYSRDSYFSRQLSRESSLSRSTDTLAIPNPEAFEFRPRKHLSMGKEWSRVGLHSPVPQRKKGDPVLPDAALANSAPNPPVIELFPKLSIHEDKHGSKHKSKRKKSRDAGKISRDVSRDVSRSRSKNHKR